MIEALNKHTGKTNRKFQGRAFIFLALLVLLFVVPQLYQQLTLDELPTTGDLIHRRIVYFLTNFPNFQDAPILISGHSQFYHELVADANILTGLTEEKAFYGVTLLNLSLLPFTVLLLYVIARRLKTGFSLLAPLLFLMNPMIVGSYFGHANQHLIGISFLLFSFLLFFLRPTIGHHVVLLLFLGLALNSSVVIWLPLALLILFLEYWHPGYHIMLTALLAALVYLVFLHAPMAYLLLGDYQASSAAKFFIFLSVVSIAAALFSFWFRQQRVRATVLGLIALAIVGVFLFAREGSPFWRTLRAEDFEPVRQTLLSIPIFDYFFSNNALDPIPAQPTYVAIMIMLSLFAVFVWIFSDIGKHMTSVVRFVSAFVVLPASIIFVQLILLRINFSYFSHTALLTLHPARVTAIVFFFAPFLFLLLLSRRFSSGTVRRITFISGLVAIFSVTAISKFYFERVYDGWTQKSYAENLHDSLREGKGENLSGAETKYACNFFNYCDLQPVEDPNF